jgi:hypothetical protein
MKGNRTDRNGNTRSLFHRPPRCQEDRAPVLETFAEELAYRGRHGFASLIRRRALLTILALASAGGLLSLFFSWPPERHAPMERYHTKIVEQRIFKVDAAQLILDWRNLRDQVVAVNGMVRCDDHICWFVSPPQLHDFVAIDTVMLPLESRRHLAFDCQAAECPMVVTGRVPYGNDMFLAEEISDDR